MRQYFFSSLLMAVMLMPVNPLQSQTMAGVAAKYPEHQTGIAVLVDISDQMLVLYEQGRETARYSVSTSSYGAGSKSGSNKTPLGAHYVRKKIGANAKSGTIFKGRKNTGKVADIEFKPRPTGDDYVTSRILWLSGLEPGKNQGPGVDSFKRYIYIHGTHEEGLIGQPASHGCVRMTNRDVIELFDRVPESSLVYIQP